MKELIYVGPSCNLGTHGLVIPGQLLSVPETEFDYIRHNDDQGHFRIPAIVEALPTGAPGEPLIPSDLEIIGVPLSDLPPIEEPGAGEAYDLTTINWSAANLPKVLAKKKPPELRKILIQMKAGGAPVEWDENSKPEYLVDQIIYGAKDEGWISETV